MKEVRLREMKVHTASVETGISTSEVGETEGPLRTLKFTLLLWTQASLQVKEVRVKEMKVHTTSVESGISTGEWSEIEVLRVHTATEETGISTSEGNETEGDESSHCFCGDWHLYK